MERIPPHNIDAERAVLGAGMQSAGAMGDVATIVTPEDFYAVENKRIFEIMLDIHKRNEAVDILTVSAELKKTGSLEKVGGMAYISMLTADVPSLVHAEAYARIVAEKASLRQLIQISDEIKEKGFEQEEETKEILDFAEKKIFEIAQKNNHMIIAT